MRILWLLEELALPYEITLYRRNPKTYRAPPELTAIHPRGRAPVVVVDGTVLAESGAIIEHLVERFAPDTLGPDSDRRQDYRFWMHYAEGSLMPPLLVKLLMDRVRSAKLPFFVKPIAARVAGTLDKNYTDPELAGHYSFIDDSLRGQSWLLGERLTGADIQMSYPLQAAADRGNLPDACANIRAWLDRVAARPAFQRAVQRDRDALAAG